MTKKTSILFSAAICSGAFLVATCLYAANTVSDVVKMENAAYEKHTKAIVSFSHKKHAVEYAAANPDLYKDACGVCHHDKDNKPLTLKEGDAVQNCIECHKTPGVPKTGTDAPELTVTEKLTYHAYAIHENCKGCHKAFNDATGKKTAPTTCTKCHLKEG